MRDVDLEATAPELATTLRAVFRVARAAVTHSQRAAGCQAADRLTALAVQAGWTQQQIADVVGVTNGAIRLRVLRQALREGPIPPRPGLLDVPSAPLSAAVQRRLRRQQLIGPAEVAALVGCAPGSVAYWAASRGVTCEWTAGRRKRLYLREAVLEAARHQPTLRRGRVLPA